MTSNKYLHKRRLTHHSRFDFNVNAVLHASPNLSNNGRANEGIRAAPFSIAKNLVHLSDRVNWCFSCVSIHFTERVRSSLDGEEVCIDCIISLEVVLYLNECHQVTFSWNKKS